ncbi:MAG TPA: hypothetical protein VL092_02455 [Chitinophagaceae bacterium]|nr:hypothetical protein [Chitinophagaceae bacterium]
MKKLLLSLGAALLFLQQSSAQAPGQISYQAAVRNGSGTPMASSSVEFRFTVRDVSLSGTTIFQETHTVTTTAQGIANLTIGSGTAVTGTFAGIDWASAAKFLEVEVNTGSGFVSIGNQQMVSVPYALHAATAGNVPFTTSGTNIYNNNTGNVGINTITPAAKLHVKGGNEILRTEFNGLGWQSFYNKTNYLGYVGTWTDTADLDFGTSGTGKDVNIVTNASPKMTIANSGEVGISTQTPSTTTKLHVNGIGSSGGSAPVYNSSIMATCPRSGSTDNSGVYAEGNWRGVFGRNKGTTSRTTALGVYGLVDSATTYTSAAYGVYGEVSATGNPGSSNYGVYGAARNGASGNYSIYGASPGGGASDYAAYFNGKIYAVSASSTIKSFKIDHPQDPTNKYLYHSSIESNDMMNIYNGNVTTDASGEATVSLPAYFTALNKDFKYQLTCMGQFAQAIVLEEVKDNQFRIKTDKPNVKVSWQVAGVRQDAAANYYRIANEVDKPAEEKGFYLVPEAYGKGAEMNASYRKAAQNGNR